jgi:hypothetical protein
MNKRYLTLPIDGVLPLVILVSAVVQTRVSVVKIVITLTLSAFRFRRPVTLNAFGVAINAVEFVYIGTNGALVVTFFNIVPRKLYDVGVLSADGVTLLNALILIDTSWTLLSTCPSSFVVEVEFLVAGVNAGSPDLVIVRITFLAG